MLPERFISSRQNRTSFLGSLKRVLQLPWLFLEKVRKEGLKEAVSMARTYLSIKIPLVLQRIRAGDSTVVRNIHGSKMELDIRLSSPNKLERMLALNGTREPATSKTFREVLTELSREGTVNVFDVGANVGYYTLLEAQVLGPDANIYAIEAHPENAKRLERNVQLNGYSQVEVLQIAAGAKRTSQELAVRDKSNIHKMSELTDGNEQTVDVDVYPLDRVITEERILEDEPVVVRMDIEGYEHRAFDGLTSTLSTGYPMYVVVEIHDRDHDPRETIIDMLRENGFRPEYVSADGGVTIREINSFTEVPSEGNVHLFAERGLSTKRT